MDPSASWLHILAVISLAAAVASAAVIAADLLAHPQGRWIMNLVWPLTALWAGPLALWAYGRFGRVGRAKPGGAAVRVAKATTHCGSGCTLGDLGAEWIALALPLTIFGHRLFGAWIFDYALAFVFGIAFQYFTSDTEKSPSERLKSALRADALSLSAWQVGMYGWMALATFAIFGRELRQTNPVFWFVMQIGMAAGFLTSYPVNAWLLRKGLKRAM